MIDWLNSTLMVSTSPTIPKSIALLTRIHYVLLIILQNLSNSQLVHLFNKCEIFTHISKCGETLFRSLTVSLVVVTFSKNVNWHTHYSNLAKILRFFTPITSFHRKIVVTYMRMENCSKFYNQSIQIHAIWLVNRN